VRSSAVSHGPKSNLSLPAPKRERIGSPRDIHGNVLVFRFGERPTEGGLPACVAPSFKVFASTDSGNASPWKRTPAIRHQSFAALMISPTTAQGADPNTGACADEKRSLDSAIGFRGGLRWSRRLTVLLSYWID
jgi:hypothetical protein